MANNCLQTQLKSNVSVQGLDYINTLKINVHPVSDVNNQRKLAFGLTNNGEIWSEGGQYSLDGGTYQSSKQTLTGGNIYLITFGEGEFFVYIKSKYDIRRFLRPSNNDSNKKDYDYDISYLNGLVAYQSNNTSIMGNWDTCFGNIAGDFYDCIYGESKATLNLDNVTVNAGLTKFSKSGAGVSGSILAFSNCGSIVEITSSGSNIYGEVSELLDALIGKKANGTRLQLQLLYSKCTYEGNPVPRVLQATFTSTSYSVTIIN